MIRNLASIETVGVYVISDLATHRERRATTPRDHAICPCGGITFELCRRPSDPEGLDHGAVVLREDGSVQSYVGAPHCFDCGQPWSPRGGWPIV